MGVVYEASTHMRVEIYLRAVLCTLPCLERRFLAGTQCRHVRTVHTSACPCIYNVYICTTVHVHVLTVHT